MVFEVLKEILDREILEVGSSVTVRRFLRNCQLFTDN